MRRCSRPQGRWDWPIKVAHKHEPRRRPMIFLGGQVDLESGAIVLNQDDLPAQIPAVIRHIDRCASISRPPCLNW